MRRKANGIAAVSSLLREYARFQKIPVDDWQVPRTQEIPTEYLRPNEIEMLRRECDRSVRAPEIRFTLDFLLSTGLRVSEFLALRWSDIDLVERRIRVRAGKGNKPRDLPMIQTAYDCSVRYLHYRYGANAEFGEARLRSDRVAPLTTRHGVESALAAIGTRAGLAVRGVHPHLLRHTFGCMWTANDWGSQRGLQLYLGHSSPITTMRYQQIVLSELVGPTLRSATL
jgi:integrase/recombinase XerD